MFKESKANNLAKNKGINPEDTQLNLYDAFDKADQLELESLVKSSVEISPEVKKEEDATAEKLKQTRQEIKKEIDYPEKPISADDDFIEPFSPAEEYYGRWK